MPYVTLYRKFRPQTFPEVKGQDHIVTALRNQLKTGRIGQAYLFTGTRGTGKTTVAKIFARAVNCEHPLPDGSPCNECPTCRSALSGNSINITEIDAASNTGVQNVRDNIIEQVKYPPAEGKYKVFIIDEVHMLSLGAFNALLKTIEEPPEYVIFILATTEVQKVPVTIRSRCQRYDFRRISLDTITARLKELMEHEKIPVEEKALRYIARCADGSMRDALSILDKCIAVFLNGDRTVTYDDVLGILGTVDPEVYRKLIVSIRNRDTRAAVDAVEDAILEGRELSQFVTDFIWYLRNLMMAKSMKDGADLLEMSEENFRRLKETAVDFDDATIIRYIRILSELLNQMRYSSQKRVLLEIAIIRMCRPQTESDTSSLAARIGELEDLVQSGVPVQQAASASVQTTPQGPAPVRKAAHREKIPDATPEEVKQMAARWKSFVEQLDDGLLKVYMDAAFVTVSARGELELVFDMAAAKPSMAAAWIDADEKNLETVKREISTYAGREIPVTIRENSSGRENADLYEDAVTKFGQDRDLVIDVEDDEEGE